LDTALGQRKVNDLVALHYITFGICSASKRRILLLQIEDRRDLFTILLGNLLFRLLFTAVLIITPSLVRLDCLIIAADFTMGVPVRVGVVLPREK
jgi:hypothetical protein